jgi:carbamate kinase
MSLLVAIGGNAIHTDDIRGTTEEQETLAEHAARSLVPLLSQREVIPPMRLDVCVAHSQGGIGYMLVQALENALARAGTARQASCIVTQVEVDAHDPAFGVPTKPIGPFFSESEARDFETKGWRMMQDAGRGWRHCVPSPEPRAIINLGVIRALLDAGVLVIAGGGGGIPVTRDAKGEWQGVQAVVDKDLTSALLARSLGIEDLLILTAVERVAIDYGTPRQRYLDQVSAAELRAHQRAGHFATGSMGPKVEAALRHVAGGGRRAIIGHLDHAAAALAGSSGTHVVAG